MPLYDFKCKNEDCNEKFEENIKVSELDEKKVKCPKCGSDDVERLITCVAPVHSTWKHWKL